MDTTTPDSQALSPGTHLEEFVVERVLGSGGFGITYLARDTSLGRQVVIKENLPTQFAWRETTTGTVRPRHTTGGDVEDYEWSMKNFLREAETLASLDHPGIVRVLRKFETHGTAYFVMPFVQGVAFDSLIEERKDKGQVFSGEELSGLTARMLDALGYLHQRGIYHRDIKPANILITMEGIPVLIDFGSARQSLSERSMTVIESPGYTPFEQLQSRGNVGPWSDLYALGATLSKAITFESPPKAADRMMGDPWMGLANDSHCLLSHSIVFLKTIDKSMSVDPLNRWQSAEQWTDVLHHVNSSAVTPHTPPSFPPPHQIVRPTPVQSARISRFDEQFQPSISTNPYQSPALYPTNPSIAAGSGNQILYTKISQVPWYRRSSVNTIVMLVSFFVCGFGVLAVCINVLTGDIYLDKKDEHGYLKKWGFGNKVAAGILLGIWVLFFLYSIAQS